MNCLVTGGAGFIGSHLCDRLLAEGHTVLAVDNFITGQKRNIKHLGTNKLFQFLKHDCSQPLETDFAPDYIFHLASPASPPKYQAKPVETMLVNTIGTYYLLELARKNNAGFIFASTSEVYGDPKEHPQKETYWGNVNPNGPRACYDEAKRAGEALVMTYVRTFDVNARIVRIFNTYGPRMDIDDGRVVTNFIKQVLHKEPLTIYGDGSQTRSFCYVSDLVEGLIRMMSNRIGRGEVINLGTTEEQTVLSFAKFVAGVAGYPNEFVFKPLPQDDPLQRKPDITKAKELLGWEPKVSLTDGIHQTLRYFRELS